MGEWESGRRGDGEGEGKEICRIKEHQHADIQSQATNLLHGRPKPDQNWNYTAEPQPIHEIKTYNKMMWLYLIHLGWFIMQQRITETLIMTLLYLKPLALHNQISLTFTVYGTWASYLISLCINFPICKLIVPSSNDCCED